MAAKLKRPAVGRPGASGHGSFQQNGSSPNTFRPHHASAIARERGRIAVVARAERERLTADNPRLKVTLPRLRWMEREP
jgi:hypothetical protein